MDIIVRSYIHLPYLIPIILGIVSGSFTVFWVTFLIVACLTLANLLELIMAVRSLFHVRN